MKNFDFDAAKWMKPLEAYLDINAALGSPDGYGQSPDGLLEAMIWDHADDPEYPPYAVRIRNLQSAPQEVQMRFD